MENWESKHHRMRRGVTESNPTNISTTRRDWYDELGAHLKLLLKSSFVSSSTTSSRLAEAGVVPEKNPEGITDEVYEALASLLGRYSRVSHMVLTDGSYEIFITQRRDAALCYKSHGKVVVVCGDPLCEPREFDSVLHEFQLELGLDMQDMAFLGMSEDFRQFAQKSEYITASFGVERNINPLTNPILAGASSKRIYTQARQLLNPNKGRMELGIYNPAQGRDANLECQMIGIYDNWRTARQDTQRAQSYLTIVDFSYYPDELFYIYVKDKNGGIHGFAGLRRLGAQQGYHLDPCIEGTTAQRGVSDLLVIASMCLAKSMKIGTLSLGYEPLNNMTGMTGTTISKRILHSLHQQANHLLQLDGKAKFNDKFKPDNTQNASLYLVFPTKSVPRVQLVTAVTAVVHLDINHLLRGVLHAWTKSCINYLENRLRSL